MPYNNRYNRKIADEYDSINERYVKHIGEEYPMQGGSLDTGFDSERIVGGARGVDEYVRNVLEGTYMIPTQAMPSSSMSGLGYSAGMRKYKGGYRIRKDLPEEEARAIARAKFEKGKEMKEALPARKSRTRKPKAMKDLEFALAPEVLDKILERRSKSAPELKDLGKSLQAQERLLRRQAREERDFMKEARRQERDILREEKGLEKKPRKPSAWNEHVAMVRAKFPPKTPLSVITKEASKTYTPGLSKRTAVGLFSDAGYSISKTKGDSSKAPRKTRVVSKTDLM
jgi:hypothetical protein